MLREKNPTKLKGAALFAYPVQVLLMNSSAKYRRWLIKYGPTVVGFLPITLGNDLKASFSIHERDFRCTDLLAQMRFMARKHGDSPRS